MKGAQTSVKQINTRGIFESVLEKELYEGKVSVEEEEQLRFILSSSPFPVITYVNPLSTVAISGEIFRFTIEDVKHCNFMLKVKMPPSKENEESAFLWTPWHKNLVRPTHEPGEYHQIRMNGFQVYQPRRTKCFDHAYPYSGSVHEIEKETPDEIKKLYLWANNILGYPNDGANGFNMCLENHYANGRQYISEHSDDESSFGKVHDVCCFVTGPASREIVLRTKGEKAHVLNDVEHVIIRIRCPEGMYVMKGKLFQERFTHEIPQEEEKLFKTLCKKLQEKHDRRFDAEPFPFKQTPGANAALTMGLTQADWMVRNREALKDLIANGFLQTNPKRNNPWSLASNKPDVEAFEKWCQHRTSFTLRSFKK